QHLLLIMVVPALLVLGRPITLLTGGTDRVAKSGLAVLRSAPARLATFPGVGLALYAMVLVLTHLTGFMTLMFQRVWAHDLEIVLYVSSGYLFLLPSMGVEPIQRWLPYPLRVFLLMIGMTVDTVVGVVLMMQAQNPFAPFNGLQRGWGPAPLTDIHTGGAIMWVFGDLLMLALVVAVIAAWMNDTEHQNDTGAWLESARRSAFAANNGGVELNADTDLDSDEAALDAYNAMLAGLRSQRQRR
ncbi:MAG: cytochrome c oxidase assembly protein, partial [Sciscionella sp.]